MGRGRRLNFTLGVLGGIVMALPGTAAQTTTAPAARLLTTDEREALERLIDQLGAAEYTRREEATRQLLSRGPEIVPQLRARLARETDPEIRRRLQYILENVVPPQQAVLLVRAAVETGLQAGDVITHVNSRPVRGETELRQRLVKAPTGGLLRVRGPSGPREVGPIRIAQLTELSDYVAPRGEVLARAVRLYTTGFAEQAYAALAELPEPIPERELSKPLHARIAYTAGDCTAALELMAGQPNSVQASSPDWGSPSYLDLSGPGKAPFHLEWTVMTRAGREAYATSNDPDLRVQRVLMPARRFTDALVRTAGYWQDQFRDRLGTNNDTNRVAGNQLAVAAWVLHGMDLRSECCRLIEPRSIILRRSSRGVRRWIRVETDAWLPFLAGNAPAALDGFYNDALGILQRPPQPGDTSTLIRNPEVAARVAFFLYQFPQDSRLEAALRAVSHHTHPALTDYFDWMLYALTEKNHTVIRHDAQSLLPYVADDRVLPYARAVALLEYVQHKPDVEVLRTAHQRISNSPAGQERDVWLGLVDALIHLASGRPSEAREALLPLRDRPETTVVWHTAGFLSDPPPSAANHAALEQPLLAVPIGRSQDQWLVLDRDRRLLRFDAPASLLTALDKPTPTWFPNPQTWPWIGREENAGRVWVYCRRRVVEISGRKDAEALRLNVRTADIPAFERYLAPHFSQLAEAVTSVPEPRGENSEFLRSEIQRHAEYVSDPNLPEIGMIRALDEAPRVVHVALRGGPHLLIDTQTARCWTSLWIRDQLGLDTPPEFSAQALWKTAPDGTPIVMLTSNQGLMRFELGNGQLKRIALPGAEPYPALVPESTPYQRRDPRFFYCARLPEDGGQVYRVSTAGDGVEAVDMINEALPTRYYDIRLRSELRTTLDERLRATGLPDLQTFIADASATVAQWTHEQPREP